MTSRALILAIAAAAAIVAGVAASFFELTVVGVIAAFVAIALGLRRRPTHGTAGR
jgi:hypothetical protein